MQYVLETTYIKFIFSEKATKYMNFTISTPLGSGSSGPSSIESVQRNSNNSGLYDKTLVVIEKSNKELEKNLTLASEVNVTSLQQPQQQPQTQVGIFWKKSLNPLIFFLMRETDNKKT